MGGHSISDDQDQEPVQLEWQHVSYAGFFVLVLAVAALALAYWAFQPAASDPASPYERGISLLAFLDVFRIGGVSWGGLLVAGVLAWFAVLLRRRSADPVAMVVDSDGLRLHGTLGGGSIPWAEVSHVKLSLGWRWPGIELGFLERRRLGVGIRELDHIVTGLDLEGGEAERFVAAAERFQRAAEAQDG